MSASADLLGQRFGSLVVQSTEKVGRRWFARCLCDCGNTKSARVDHLRGGSIASCKRNDRILPKRAPGKSTTLEYRSWQAMRARCTHEHHQAYPYYGARGISVCAQWLNSFDNFLADMGPRPSPQHSLDRIDNNGNYEPGNCRWATSSEQAFNRRPKSNQGAA